MICEKELRFYFKRHCHLLCTRESGPGYESARAGRQYLEKTIGDSRKFAYVCGPDQFVDDIRELVRDLGFSDEAIVFEE